MRRYLSYKDSGVEWIGEIPSHWEINSLKRICDIHNQQISKEEFNNKNVIHYSIPNVQEFGSGILENGNEIDSSKILLRGGEVLISKLNPRKSCTTIVKYENELIIGSGEFLTFTTQKEILINWYLHYLFKNHNFIEFLDSSVESVTRSHQRVRPDIVYSIKIGIPPLSEQNQIVSYLDRKTEEIDKLIQTKVRKIELLKEYRTSLINEVVTKGLNPNVEMKDSGVEWIGEIPSGWGVKRLKNVSDVKPSNVDKHIFPDEIQVRLCNYTDVYYNDFISESTELNPGSCNEMEFEKLRLKKGDVIITKDSESPDDIGIPCLVKDDFDDVVCGYHLTLIRPQNMDGGFIFRFIQSDRTRRYFEIHSNGITRYGLGKSSIENLFLPFPPLSEQTQIVSYLDEQTQLIDKNIQTEERKIEILKEFRQSLISEVVTGKIKVCTDEEVH